MESFVKLSDIKRIYDVDMNQLGKLYQLDGTDKIYQFVQIPISTQVQERQAVKIPYTYIALPCVITEYHYNGIAAYSVLTDATDVKYMYVQVGGFCNPEVNAAPTYVAGDSLMNDATTAGVLTQWAPTTVDPTLDQLMLGANAILQVHGVKASTNVQMSGTVTVAAATATTLNGLNTRFTHEFKVGDTIVVGSTTKTVSVITSDTDLTVSVTFGAAVTKSSIYRTIYTLPAKFK